MICAPDRPAGDARTALPGRPGTASSADRAIRFQASRRFAGWLASQHASLAFSTYQAGKLFFVGVDERGELSVFNRTLARVMGLAAHGSTLWVATLWQLWRFEDARVDDDGAQGAHDRWYVPQLAHTTGDIDVHDVAVDGDGEPVFVSTLFSCLARPDPRYSFRPVWKPPFISRIAAEDRCHLNGLAMRDGRPGFVTCVARTDVGEGWREHRRSGGVVVDVGADAIVAAGLSMPHSPRWHRGRLWLLNAGSGELGTIDLDSGRFLPVAFCPGFLRGLSFCGDFAIIGSSEQREQRTMADLELDARLSALGVRARCALFVVDLRTGDVAHELRIEGAVRELFDTAVLAGARNPGAVGFRTDEIARTLVLPRGASPAAAESDVARFVAASAPPCSEPRSPARVG
jgi:uncharacterized protein (TIGR03032 family)